MIASRYVLFAICAALLSGCGKQSINGVYLDPSNPSVRYELREGNAWSAEMIVEVPAGVFPHGSGRRLEGKFTKSGNLLDLVCTSASRQDPISGQFQPEAADLAAYNHKLLVEDGALVPVGPEGNADALFASDLNPFGARQLLPEKKPQ